jgi:hypothetical protein
MLHKGYDLSGSTARTAMVMSLKRAWLQNALNGSKPAFVKQL